MKPEFLLSTKWADPCIGSPELRQTSALIRIEFGDNIATRADNEWSGSIVTEPYLSAYPLAVWFASSWWRLRWEPASDKEPSSSWRMAHETAAAGYGFIWPRLSFASEGNSLSVTCRSTENVAAEPLRYLSRFHTSVPAPTFERVIDDFISLVLARLNDVGIVASELHSLWREVLEERNDPEASFYRKMEAMLGFEPDEAPETMLARLRDISITAGEAAISEIAPVCSGPSPADTLNHVISLSNEVGLLGKIQPPASLLRTVQTQDLVNCPPWERGWSLARQVRSTLGIPAGPVDDRILREIFSLPQGVLLRNTSNGNIAPLGLAIREGAGDDLKLLFRKRNRTGGRFEAARILADHLTAPNSDCWLPLTETKTARQKIQRAFAVEFLCPIEELQSRVDGRYSDEALDEAGEHYGVSPLAIRSLLVSNGLLPQDVLQA